MSYIPSKDNKRAHIICTLRFPLYCALRSQHTFCVPQKYGLVVVCVLNMTPAERWWHKCSQRGKAFAATARFSRNLTRTKQLSLSTSLNAQSSLSHLTLTIEHAHLNNSIIQSNCGTKSASSACELHSFRTQNQTKSKPLEYVGFEVPQALNSHNKGQFLLFARPLKSISVSLVGILIRS